MHSSILFTLFSLVLSPVLAANIINNRPEAQRLAGIAKTIPNGSYKLQNVRTGQIITQTREGGNSIFPERGSGTAMQLTQYSANPSYTILRTPQYGKCISAQWDAAYDSGADWAGALYACQVDPVPASSTLNPDKQYWYFVPSPVEGAYFIIAIDHINDMATRGLQGCTRDTYSYKSICLDIVNYRNTAFMWYLQPDGGSSPATTAASSTSVKAPSTTKISTPAQDAVVTTPGSCSATVTVTVTATPRKRHLGNADEEYDIRKRFGRWAV